MLPDDEFDRCRMPSGGAGGSGIGLSGLPLDISPFPVSSATKFGHAVCGQDESGEYSISVRSCSCCAAAFFRLVALETGEEEALFDSVEVDQFRSKLELVGRLMELLLNDFIEASLSKERVAGRLTASLRLTADRRIPPRIPAPAVDVEGTVPWCVVVLKKTAGHSNFADSIEFTLSDD